MDSRNTSIDLPARPARRRRLPVFLVASFAAIVIAGPAAGANSYIKGFLQVRNPWTRVTPPGAEVAAGYLEIRNTGRERDRLIAVSTPAAERVEMHVMSHEGGVTKMREVPGMEVPARKQLLLRPGGPHLMIVGPRKNFVKGQRIPLVLRFERGGDVHVELQVRALAPANHRH